MDPEGLCFPGAHAKPPSNKEGSTTGVSRSCLSLFTSHPETVHTHAVLVRGGDWRTKPLPPSSPSSPWTPFSWLRSRRVSEYSAPPVTLNGLADSHAETAARTAAEAQLTQAAEADFVSEAAAAPPPFPHPPFSP